MIQLTVLEAYEKMTNILQEYFDTNLKGHDFENVFDNLLFTISLDNEGLEGESRDPMCYFNFKKYCSVILNKKITDNAKIDMVDAYDGMMYVLNDYIETWDDMADKKYLVSLEVQRKGCKILIS